MSTFGGTGAGDLISRLDAIAGRILDLSFRTPPSPHGERPRDNGPNKRGAVPCPTASLDLSTRGFMESEHVGEYFVILQVDNLRSHLLTVSGPGDYKGFYDISRLKFGITTALVDDEKEPVPVTVTRLRDPKGYADVRLEVWASLPPGLSVLSPYMRNPFK